MSPLALKKCVNIGLRYKFTNFSLSVILSITSSLGSAVLTSATDKVIRTLWPTGLSVFSLSVSSLYLSIALIAAWLSVTSGSVSVFGNDRVKRYSSLLSTTFWANCSSKPSGLYLNSLVEQSFFLSSLHLIIRRAMRLVRVAVVYFIWSRDTKLSSWYTCKTILPDCILFRTASVTAWPSLLS